MRTLFDILWDIHIVHRFDDGEDLLYIDRVFLHERTGGIALKSLHESGRSVRRPKHAFAVMDHIVSTQAGRGLNDARTEGGDVFLRITRKEAQRAGLKLFDSTDEAQGIVHVISPEQGIILPGLTLVAPDSHTCTQGAFGALAFGIGSSQAEQALATSCLRVKRPKTMQVKFDGILPPTVTAKDMILHLIASYGAAGGRGYAIEFCGQAVTALGMEARMTLCNMAVEFGAFTGLIAPDDKTFDWLKGRPYAPQGEMWAQAMTKWQGLRSDNNATFDKVIKIDAGSIAPMVSWGTSPEQSVAVNGPVPVARHDKDTKALAYMGLEPGQTLAGLAIDAVYIGSCTNARLSDLRIAAQILRGRTVASPIKAMCVPGSTAVKHAAEAEGLDKIFKAAGFEWNESGCGLCFYAGGEGFAPGSRVLSTTNRNFEGRQGPGVRTHITNPALVAASAVAGHICTPEMLEAET